MDRPPKGQKNVDKRNMKEDVTAGIDNAPMVQANKMISHERKVEKFYSRGSTLRSMQAVYAWVIANIRYGKGG